MWIVGGNRGMDKALLFEKKCNEVKRKRERSFLLVLHDIQRIEIMAKSLEPNM